MSYVSDSEHRRREESRNRLLAFLLMVVIAVAVFLLTPGMAVIAVLADVFSLRLGPSQMWAFSFAISVCIFAVFRFCSPTTTDAGKRYALLSGVLSTAFIIFLFGFEASFAARWVVRFFPASEASSPASPLTTPMAPAPVTSEAIASQETPVEVRRAIPVSQPLPPLQPFHRDTKAVPPPPVYSIRGVARGDTLNIRSGPGMDYATIKRLPNGAKPIHIIGGPVLNNTTEWVQIAFGEQSGWVSKLYLKDEADQ